MSGVVLQENWPVFGSSYCVCLIYVVSIINLLNSIIMAIVQNSLIGRTKRSVGNTTFVTLYGQNILKAKAMEVRDANTAVQQTFRVFFALVVVFAKWLNYSIAVKKRFAGNTSLYPGPAFPFIVKAITKARSGIASLWTIDWTKVTLGVGAIPPQSGITVAASVATHNITISWEAVPVGNQTLNDPGSIVLLNTTKQLGHFVDNALTRADEDIIVEVPADWKLNDQCVAFLMFDGYQSTLIDAPTGVTFTMGA